MFLSWQNSFFFGWRVRVTIKIIISSIWFIFKTKNSFSYCTIDKGYIILYVIRIKYFKDNSQTYNHMILHSLNNSNSKTHNRFIDIQLITTFVYQQKHSYVMFLLHHNSRSNFEAWYKFHWTIISLEIWVVL